MCPRQVFIAMAGEQEVEDMSRNLTYEDAPSTSLGLSKPRAVGDVGVGTVEPRTFR